MLKFFKYMKIDRHGPKKTTSGYREPQADTLNIPRALSEVHQAHIHKTPEAVWCIFRLVKNKQQWVQQRAKSKRGKKKQSDKGSLGILCLTTVLKQTSRGRSRLRSKSRYDGNGSSTRAYQETGTQGNSERKEASRSGQAGTLEVSWGGAGVTVRKEAEAASPKKSGRIEEELTQLKQLLAQHNQNIVALRAENTRLKEKMISIRKGKENVKP